MEHKIDCATNSIGQIDEASEMGCTCNADKQNNESNSACLPSYNFLGRKMDLFNLLINNAKDYRGDANASLMRNQHMHKEYNPGIINIGQPEIDALLTDFINFVAFKQCCDLGLYAEDLKAPKEL